MPHDRGKGDLPPAFSGSISIMGGSARPTGFFARPSVLQKGAVLLPRKRFILFADAAEIRKVHIENSIHLFTARVQQILGGGFPAAYLKDESGTRLHKRQTGALRRGQRDKKKTRRGGFLRRVLFMSAGSGPPLSARAV